MTIWDTTRSSRFVVQSKWNSFVSVRSSRETNPPDRRHQTVKLILTVSLSIQNNLTHVCARAPVRLCIYIVICDEQTHIVCVFWDVECSLVRSLLILLIEIETTQNLVCLCANVLVCFFLWVVFDRMYAHRANTRHLHIILPVSCYLSFTVSGLLASEWARARVCVAFGDENIFCSIGTKKNWVRAAQCG